MKLHPNAKSTPKSRELMVRRVLDEGWDVGSVAEANGVSQRTVWKWIARYRQEGMSGLQDRACAPARVPRRTPERLERRIERLRRKRLVAFQIARILGMARSTVSAVLVRLGLNRLSVLEPREPANSYEWPLPGQLLHVDVKKLGRFTRAGHRVHGDRTRCSRGAGWECIHVCVDDHTRLAYVEALEDEKAVTAVGFLRRAVAWFAELGVRAERVMTDNGACYKRTFELACDELGLRHLRTRPYRPRTNGKAERFIQTMIREWAYARPYRSTGWRRRALQPWVQYYNTVRNHGSLGDCPPMTRIPGAC